MGVRCLPLDRDRFTLRFIRPMQNSEWESIKEKSTVSESDWITLMHRVQQGDQAAYDVLLTLLQDILRRFLSKRVPADDVEDVLQVILMGVHTSRHTFITDRPFLAWVFAIARFKMMDFYRNRSKNECVFSVDFDEMDDSLLAYSENKDGVFLMEHLQEALDSLSGPQKDIIVALKLQGYSVKEIAEVKGMSVSAVKTCAHRAYKQLKCFLEKYYDET